MDVKKIKLLHENGAILDVELSETELQLLLSYAINDLLNRGSISLFNPEDAEKMDKLEKFLHMQTEGSTQ